MTVSEFQSSFVLKPPYIHLNNAGMALPAKPAVEIVQNWVSRFQVEAAHSAPEFIQHIETSRSSLAKFLGCQPRELAFFQSTSGAVSQVAFGMDLKPGDEIITWDQEYPSNFLPWREAAVRTGAKLITVSSNEDMSTPVQSLLNAITPKTKVIAISWVQYQTGAITDLQALTKETRARNILTVVDGIQGFGLLPFNFKTSGVDIICGGSHKWMLSFWGGGFLVVRDELIPQLKPIMIGTGSFKPSNDPENPYQSFHSEASGFEPGSKQFLEIAAIGAAAEFLSSVTVEAVAAKIQERSNYLRKGLERIGCQVHSPHSQQPAGALTGSIVNFSRGDLKEQHRMEDILKKNKVSYIPRAKGLRFSPHVYNTEQEIDFVLSLLEK